MTTVKKVSRVIFVISGGNHIAASRPLSLRAILIGAAIDIGGTLSASFMIGVVAAIVLLIRGVPPDRMAEILRSDSRVLVAGFAYGLVFSFLGVFVAARLARQRELTHAVATAAICVLLGLTLSTRRGR